MENLNTTSQEVKRLHELASLYHEMGSKARQLITVIKDTELEVAHLLEKLEVIKAEEEELYLQIATKNNVTRQVAVETVINALIQ